MTHKKSGYLALVSSVLICGVLGSIHAFSVFLEALEASLGQSRATVSLAYSFALVALTATVLLGPRLYTLLSPARLFIIAGCLGSIGAVIAGLSGGISGVWIGYSLGFGVANGLGYGFALQYAAVANPDRPGAAMGIVTAAYAFGAAFSPVVFVQALQFGGFLAAMMGLAIVLSVIAVVAASLASKSGVEYVSDRNAPVVPLPNAKEVIRTWIAYGTGVAAGLMVIGHAAGIAGLAGYTPWHAPAILASCNLLGSLFGGHLVDRLSRRLTLTALPLISVLGLAALALDPSITLVTLGMIGFAYGGTIAAYPAVIAKNFPGLAGPRVYGIVFTAWGTAGLIAPWGAGLLFDKSQSYQSSLWIALAFALISAGMAARNGR